MMRKVPEWNRTRRAGLLFPISALPGPYEIGDFGYEAKRVVDWMVNAGIKEWLLLPLGPISHGNSPYQSTSAFAGNIYYISPDILMEEGLLKREDLEREDYGRVRDQIDYGQLFTSRRKLLRKAYMHFIEAKGLQRKDYLEFCEIHQKWLDDYAIFMALKEINGYRPWWQWEQVLASRTEPYFSKYIQSHKEEVIFWKFTQYEFFKQWEHLKKYANDKGIYVIGDMPFYLGPDSADVWSHRELFGVNPKTGMAEIWAGVPADTFSMEDRNWKNPTYCWEAHEETDYEWFRQRIRISAVQYDGMRIDHVIAIMRYFGIRDGEKKGKWYDGPDTREHKLSEAIQQEAERTGLHLMAEDLGDVPPGLREMMMEMGWNSMRVLQFAFTGKHGAKSDHLPFYHRSDMAVFTGTHDHPTLKEFLGQKKEAELQYLKWWTGKSGEEMLRWALIEEAYKSPACQVFVPIQDLLGMGSEARMVFTNDPERSWKWRLADIDMLSVDLAEKVRALAVLTGRYPAEKAEFFQCLEKWSVRYPQ